MSSIDLESKDVSAAPSINLESKDTSTVASSISELQSGHADIEKAQSTATPDWKPSKQVKLIVALQAFVCLVVALDATILTTTLPVRWACSLGSLYHTYNARLFRKHWAPIPPKPSGSQHHIFLPLLYVNLRSPHSQMCSVAVQSSFLPFHCSLSDQSSAVRATTSLVCLPVDLSKVWVEVASSP